MSSTSDDDKTRLKEKIGYELRVLDLASGISDAFDGSVDPTLIELDQRRHGAVIGAKVSITIGESLGAGSAKKVIDSIAALYFITCFKVLDMIVEWILEKNFDEKRIADSPAKLNFVQKAKLMTDPNLSMPPIFDSEKWLRSTVEALYESLRPYRNEVVHGSDYELRDDTLVVSDPKSGSALELNTLKLGALARFVVCLGKCLAGDLQLDDFVIRLVKYYSDGLVEIHGGERFNQDKPLVVNVELTVPEADGVFPASLEYVRQEVTRIHPGREVLFNLTVVGIPEHGEPQRWQFSYDTIPDLDMLKLKCE